MAQITLNSSGVASSGSLLLQTNGTTTQATLDTSGNLGLGVTPSAWVSSWRALEIGTLAGASIYSSAGGLRLGSNLYRDSVGYKYAYNGPAADLQMDNGAYLFRIAASGTAGNAITFTQAMTLDASGNLGVGITSPTARIDAYQGTQVNSTFRAYGPAGQILWANGGTSTSYLDSDTIVFRASANSSNTERARIDSSGNLLVGTTTADTYCRFSAQGAVGSRWGFGPSLSGSDLFRVQTGAGATGVYLTAGNTSWTANSDERLKTDLISIENAVNKVSTLRAVTGRYKTDEKGRSRAFLIAQDVQKVLPEAVDSSDPEKLGVQYADVIPLLVAAIKELNAKFETYKAAHP